MSILNAHIAFVNQQMEFQQKMAKKFAIDPRRQALHLSTSEKFKSLATDLIEADKRLDTVSSDTKSIAATQQLTLFPTELDGLPEELLKELSISEADKTEQAILKLIEESGGMISLDRLLVGLYRKTGDIHKRVTMTSKMYRMSQKGYAFPVPGKKGIYSARKLSEEDVTKLFAAPEETPETA